MFAAIWEDDKMTGTSETDARPNSAQTGDNAVESVSGPARQSTPQASGLDHGIGDPRRDVSDQVWSVAEETRDGLAETIEPAKQKAKSFAEDQKAAGARKIGDVAHVVHDAATRLQSELPQAARSIHDAAGALEQASVALRERSIDELVTSCLDFGRARPGVFFGAAALAGFAMARFVKSSAEPVRTNPKR
jgi:hypothetical protein